MGCTSRTVAYTSTTAESALTDDFLHADMDIANRQKHRRQCGGGRAIPWVLE